MGPEDKFWPSSQDHTINKLMLALPFKASSLHGTKLAKIKPIITSETPYSDRRVTSGAKFIVSCHLLTKYLHRRPWVHCRPWTQPFLHSMIVLKSRWGEINRTVAQPNRILWKSLKERGKKNIFARIRVQETTSWSDSRRHDGRNGRRHGERPSPSPSDRTAAADLPSEESERASGFLKGGGGRRRVRLPCNNR